MEMNRREFLRTAGKAALGAVAVSSLPLSAVAEEQKAPVWPWKYVPLDKGKRALDAAGIPIPFPQMDVHVKS